MELAPVLLRARQIALTIRRRAIVTAALFAVLFTTIGVAQYFFVRHQLFSSAYSDAAAQATEISGEVADTNGLNLTNYRQAFITAGEWCIVAPNGMVIDIESTTPSLLGRVLAPTKISFSGLQTIASQHGEQWRIFAKQLKGGAVALGLNNPSQFRDPDATLLANAAKFGDTLQDALRVNPHSVEWAIDYAVFDQNGEMQKAWGELPLRADPAFLSELRSKREVVLEGTPYLLASRDVTDASQRPIATVVVQKEVTAEHRAIRDQVRFNVGVSVLAWLVVVSIVMVYFVRDEIRRQHIHPSLAEARKQGEGQHVEFKRSLLWNRERGYADENLRSKVLKTIVAFLNSGGGTLFIGVQDSGQPWGLADDLQQCDGSEDKLHQRLRNLIANSIGAQFSHYITSRIEDDPDYAGFRVCCVGVGVAPDAAFLRVSNHSYFYVRSGPETRELDMQQAYHYIRNAGLQI
jgi:hypothetical protein